MTGKNGSNNFMNNNCNKILIADSSLEISEIKKYFENESVIIIAADYNTHKKFSKLNIKFLDLDDFVNKNNRSELYEFTNRLLKWHQEIPNQNEFKIDDVNILDFLSPLELHEFILSKMIKFFSIKNTIETFHPKQIIISDDMSYFVQELFSKDFTEIIPSSNKIEQKGIINDQIEIRFNISSKPITFYISKKLFSKLKKISDKIFSSLYDLKLKNYKKEIILLLEFNPSLYADLISNISNSNKTVVLFNQRRPILLDNTSRNILKEINAKVINSDDFLDSKYKKEILTKQVLLIEAFDKLWNDRKLSEIFSWNNTSFWSVIKPTLKNIYNNRLDDYLKLHFISKNILESLNIKSILCLNESGQTENIFLQNNQNKIKSFLLQHSFLRYQKSIYETQWIYEDQRIHGFKSDNFLLWGDADYDFFTKFSNIDTQKLIKTGSPRHDVIKSNLTSSPTKKITVLITLTPISVRSGNQTVALIEKYDLFLKRIINSLKTKHDVEIIIKLHPGENLHNNILLNSLEQFDNITVFQTKNPYKLIEKSNFLITITPELYDSSTIMLDALSLETPVIQFILDSSNSLSNTIDEPISTFFENDNAEEILQKYMDNDYCQSLIKKIPQKLEKLLSNQGNSCQNIAKILSQ